MLSFGRKLSPEVILALVRSGRYCLTLEEAMAKYGDNFVPIQPVPQEVMQFLPQDYKSRSLMMGLYVPGS